MSPPVLRQRVLEVLEANPGVVNLVMLPGVAKHPDGDDVRFDVITAEANRVLAQLRHLEVDRCGSIMIETVETAISAAVARAEGREPTGRDYSPIWEQVDARIRDLGHYPPSWFALLAIAGLIATVGILTNSQILVVGAMIVGPEYGAVVSVALAINQADLPHIRQGVSALVVGFGIAIVASVAFGAVIRGLSLQPEAFSLGVRPVADLINSPNLLSVLVAVLAGIVGAMSLVESRATTLIGVFVSVTTIPAAANVGVSIAFHNWAQVWGSLLQLALNIVLLIATGAVVLFVQRRLWRRWGGQSVPR
ncbi:MAG TPA: DUF389 domain-containing protein [Acidimicrobiales bacterium]|nr:DUF389 domain-containing protein [Acidimicrobiales bacterium]